MSNLLNSTPNELVRLVALSIAADVPLAIWGEGGGGKSEIVQQACTKLGYEYFSLRAATQDVAEVVGYTYLDKKTGRMKWGPPDWWPKSNQKMVIFFDELNRASTRFINGIFQLLQEKCLHMNKVPEATRIIVAVNPPNKFNNVNTFDNPLNTRFSHTKLIVNAEEWIANCANFIAEDVIAYISSYPDELTQSKNDFDISQFILKEPRTWEMASKLWNASGDLSNATEHKTLLKALASTITPSSATAFLRFAEGQWTRVIDILNGTKSLADLESHSDVTRLTTLIPTAITNRLFANASLLDTDIYKKNLISFITDLANSRPDMAVALSVTAEATEGYIFDAICDANDLNELLIEIVGDE